MQRIAAILLFSSRGLPSQLDRLSERCTSSFSPEKSFRIIEAYLNCYRLGFPVRLYPQYAAKLESDTNFVGVAASVAPFRCLRLNVPFWDFVGAGRNFSGLT